MMDNTKLVSVGELLDELRYYGEEYLEYQIFLFAPGEEGEDYGIYGIEQDENGLIRIDVDWIGWGDGLFYNLEEIIYNLSAFDRDTKVYLESPVATLTFDTNHSIFCEPDNEGEFIGAYILPLKKKESVDEPTQVPIAPAPTTSPAPAPRKRRNPRRIWLTLFYLLMDVVFLVGLCYNVVCLIKHTKDVCNGVFWILFLLILIAVCTRFILHPEEDE